MSNYELKSFADDTALARAAAEDWLKMLSKSSLPYLVAVSGGRIAQTFFSAVSELAGPSWVSFKNVHFFWADERCVPPDHPDSNFRVAEEFLLQPMAIALEKIHRLKGELPPEEAVTEANAALQHLAPQNSAGVPMLDLIFLGLGENGHTASLMPNAPPEVAKSHAPFIYVPNSPKPPPERVSMSYATLAAAKNVWMLAAGKGKEEALRQSVQPNGQTPFARVLQSRPQTVIYTDIAI
jgi:6-phosphogluconolactonase